ncbi:hypothetical protein GCM10022254_33210 [Actinomadura meridiana]|uniref:Uncharacterized protein n=1 Tax=Actinomadura meridiana TaxID=559626 RepID=A0ABP8C3Q8_9ACTN
MDTSVSVGSGANDFAFTMAPVALFGVAFDLMLGAAFTATDGHIGTTMIASAKAIITTGRANERPVLRIILPTPCIRSPPLPRLSR